MGGVGAELKCMVMVRVLDQKWRGKAHVMHAKNVMNG